MGIMYNMAFAADGIGIVVGKTRCCRHIPTAAALFHAILRGWERERVD